MQAISSAERCSTYDVVQAELHRMYYNVGIQYKSGEASLVW